jgi:UDP-N-acetylglucosamine diphosphorylase/glucosamine-1-phosphate N-acetyltransferase
MNYILFDDDTRDNLLPLTFTRPIAEIRIGILKISEKWERRLGEKISFLTRDYLSCKYPMLSATDNVLINGAVLPVPELITEIHGLNPGQLLKKENAIVAARLNDNQLKAFENGNIDKFENIISSATFIKLEYPWDIFSYNESALNDDYHLITKGRKSAPISNTNKVTGVDNLFIEEGASVEFSIINAKIGPVYIGKEAEVMEGCLVRGPLALCEHSTLKMGAKIYGATTIGPHSKIGGEISNSVVFGYTNKAHDGFLGNSVIGEWCNLGADTNNSNLKNNYAEVKAWNYAQEHFIKTGLQFCGLIMGDHSKSAINTMFNTGTVVGVNANIFGAGFPRNFIPSFSWGGSEGLATFALNKAYEVASMVMKRRGIVLEECDMQILRNIFEYTDKYRHF